MVRRLASSKKMEASLALLSAMGSTERKDRQLSMTSMLKSLVGPGSFLGDFESSLGGRFLVNSVFRVDFALHDRTGILVAKLAHLFALLYRVAFATATYMVNIIHMAPCNESL